MTLKEEFQKERKEFKISRISFIKEQVIRQIRKGKTTFKFSPEFYDDETLLYLDQEGINYTIEEDPYNLGQYLLIINL